jgi:hypothetical protein
MAGQRQTKGAITMFISSWFPWRLARKYKGRTRPALTFRRGTRLACEQLEDRTVPSNLLTAANVTDLINDINYANAHPGSYTIALVAGNTYTLTAADNATDGGNGLPVIAASDNLTIQGNGDTIARNTAAGTPTFRLFDVAPGASLTLANVTVEGGTAQRGGGIYSSGSLTLEAGTLIQRNQSIGAPGQASGWGGYYWLIPGGDGDGGGVFVAAGTATLTNVTLSSNSAQGGQGAVTPDGLMSVKAGSGLGGALCVAGGGVSLTNSILSANSAQGGQGGRPGSGWGGGLFVTGGTVTLTSDGLSSNTADVGGGVCVSAGTVTMTSDTVSSNTASNYGGGVYVSAGTVTMTSGTISSNTAGIAGGGVWVGLGTVAMTYDTLSSNTAGGWGGALFVTGGTVTLRDDTVTGNFAGTGTSKGRQKRGAYGGGVYINPGAINPPSSVYLDAFSMAHTTGNTPDDIVGSYTLI